MANPIDTSTVQKVILSNDLEIAYTDGGEGDNTLVFIHGLTSNLHVWDANISVFRKYYRCLALDLPGHGASSAGDLPYTIDFFVDTLLRFLDHFRIGSCVLIGHSMGGQTAIRAVLEHPQRFQRLVLAAPAGFETFTETQKQIIRHSASNIVSSSLYAQMLLSWKSKFNELDKKEKSALHRLDTLHGTFKSRQLEKLIKACVTGMLKQPIYQDLHLLRLPVLVLFGEEDKLIPNRMFNTQSTYEVAKSAVEQMPDAKLVMLPGGGHYLQIDKPEKFNLEVYKFLNPHIY